MPLDPTSALVRALRPCPPLNVPRAHRSPLQSIHPVWRARPIFTMFNTRSPCASRCMAYTYGFACTSAPQRLSTPRWPPVAQSTRRAGSALIPLFCCSAVIFCDRSHLAALRGDQKCAPKHRKLGWQDHQGTVCARGPSSSATLHGSGIDATYR
ncbi:hypothetical protein FA95DRAFT_587878 [Auriscalpium vulgare]|uniref:Uncharacterized protein n=1 Tax=Auriscalpium vulgare TaxID=40419 RepID=A0ACB8RE00_9AGAM|nr:hypothetical protein FA95DRAFT_587878 [Auriscalpium vulgare]